MRRVVVLRCSLFCCGEKHNNAYVDNCGRLSILRRDVKRRRIQDGGGNDKFYPFRLSLLLYTVSIVKTGTINVRSTRRF